MSDLDELLKAARLTSLPLRLETSPAPVPPEPTLPPSPPPEPPLATAPSGPTFVETVVVEQIRNEDVRPAGSKVLVVEDDVDSGITLVRLLAQQHLLPTRVETAEAALEAIEQTAFDVVLAALQLPGMSGMQLLRELRRRQPEVPVVVLAGHGSIQLALEAMRAGAADFLQKPVQPEELLSVLTRALASTQAARNAPPPAPEEARPLADEILGSSKALETVRREIRILAKGESNVLIRGEPGTGKHLAARAIHALSARAGRPFVRVDCACLPAGLFDAEMFGCVRSGHSRPGQVELAEGGTLFLDELADLALPHQVTLLTFLQDKGYAQVGGSGRTLHANVRVIAATRRPLERLMAGGAFRQDLLDRFEVDLQLPPLRERRDDIVLLAKHFLRLHAPNASLSPGAVALLREQEWPGNVRELRGFVERLVLFSPSPAIDEADVRRELERCASSAEVERSSLQTQRAAVAEALRKAGGNRTLAARLLGVSRRTLYNWIEELRRAEAEEATRGQDGKA